MNGTHALNTSFVSPRPPPPVGVVTALTVFAAILAGLAIGVLPWWLVLASSIGLALVAAIAWRPVVGLALTILLAFQAIPGSITPDIPLGFLRAKPYELTFILMLLSILARQIPGQRSEQAHPMPRDALGVTLLTIVIVLFSAFYSQKFLLNRELVLAESRGFFAILFLPALHLTLRSTRDIAVLKWCLTLAGLAVSTWVLVQMLTGKQILAGRLEDLELSKGSGVMRSVTDTSVLVQAFAIYHLSLVVRWSRLSSLPALMGLMLAVAGLLGTFTRGAWIGAAMGGLFAAFVRGGFGALLRTILGGIALLTITLCFTLVLHQRSAMAMIDRATGIKTEITHGASFGWRQIENQVAFEAIAKHPILGVGIGGAYKQTLSSAGSFENEEFFIHNGYLYFPLKMGIPGVILLGSFLGLYMIHFRQCTRLPRSSRGTDIAIAAGTTLMATIICIEGPVLTKFPGLLLFCALVFLTDRSYRSAHSQPDGTPAAPRSQQP